MDGCCAHRAARRKTPCRKCPTLWPSWRRRGRRGSLDSSQRLSLALRWLPSEVWSRQHLMRLNRRDLRHRHRCCWSSMMSCGCPRCPARGGILRRALEGQAQQCHACASFAPQACRIDLPLVCRHTASIRSQPRRLWICRADSGASMPNVSQKITRDSKEDCDKHTWILSKKILTNTHGSFKEDCDKHTWIHVCLDPKP